MDIDLIKIKRDIPNSLKVYDLTPHSQLLNGKLILVFSLYESFNLYDIETEVDAVLLHLVDGFVIHDDYVVKI